MGFFSYQSLAPLNSILNSVAAVLLLAGFLCIRRGWVRAHRAFMLSAFATSVAFFTSYVIYHYHVGDVRFQGHGWVRPVYFTILVSHVGLAVAIVPLALITLWRALHGRYQAHRRIAVWTWPIWIYVSITGVIVYLMCYQLYAPRVVALLSLKPPLEITEAKIKTHESVACGVGIASPAAPSPARHSGCKKDSNRRAACPILQPAGDWVFRKRNRGAYKARARFGRINLGSALEEIPHRRAKLRLLLVHRQMTRILDGLQARVLDAALELARVDRRN